MGTDKHTITFEYWVRTCSDGCCTDFGEKVYVDGECVGDIDHTE